ncbi:MULTISPECIES: hypothetical protein [Idiomarina]|uniref:hypothetical protein n=1 Tax=Idiomarina TaxID=135575 RepID=UPI000C0D2304|nr:hypothetical protein [Idiomarina sp.]PHQ89892.1 MAG: hypothetical protein COB44_07370 [Idiomarina sp.]
MQSTTSSFTMRALLVTGFLSITIASPFSVAKDTNTESETCSYNEVEMLKLSPREFDQNLEKGWREVAKAEACREAAADLIHTYYTKNEISKGAMRTFVWHEGQLRAEVGQYQRAISLMKQARKSPEKDMSGWNYYVDATIAFLQSDREKLKNQREKLAAVPKPEGFNPTDADGNPIEIQWPPNLNIIDKFIRCFDQPYSEVYTECTAEK